MPSYEITADNEDGSSVYIPGTTAKEDYGLPLMTQRKLANLNDAGNSFDEIANWIEENL